MVDQEYPKFKKDALLLLLKYGGHCCIKSNLCLAITDFNKLEKHITKILPNASNHILILAEEYGISEINEMLVHAYFFTYHNNRHDIENNEIHKVYLGIVKEVYEGLEKIKVKVINNERLVYNVYGLSVRPKDNVIIHTDYIVTTDVPEIVKRLSHEKDIRAWEPYLRGR